MLIEKSRTSNCLVFCHFTKEIDMIGEKMSEANIGWRRYDGTVDLVTRNEYLKEFLPVSKRSDNPDAPKVLFIQIKAGGVGLNLQQFTEVFINSPD